MQPIEQTCAVACKIIFTLKQVQIYTKSQKEQNRNREINCVSDIIDVLTGIFIHPFTDDINLVSISSGLEAPKKISDDLINAKYIGEKAMNKFVEDRLHTYAV